jgi:peroxiredoxin
VVLFSHPADFTPVCTTGFMACANICEELKSLTVQLVGLSVDSISAHLAWVHEIREKMGIAIPFPIIADLTMKVARKYGMIHPGQSSTAAVRSVFFIDDKGITRGLVPLLQERVNTIVFPLLCRVRTTGGKIPCMIPASLPGSAPSSRKRKTPENRKCSFFCRLQVRRRIRYPPSLPAAPSLPLSRWRDSGSLALHPMVFVMA